jgi:hypothetical protein
LSALCKSQKVTETIQGLASHVRSVLVAEAAE